MRLNINDLWIGERLIVKDEQLIGTFEGKVNDQNILLKVKDKLIIFNIDKVELAPDEIVEPKIDFLDPDVSSSGSNLNKVKWQIDLHIEKLDPSLLNDRPERIFIKQITAFDNFMKNAIQYRLPHLFIIHGKGEGILKEEIRSLLKLKYKAKLILPTNQDGATEVWL